MSKRVFFSFHYQDVIDFRANVVRQHWMTKPDRETAGFFDASIWGNAELSGNVGIKRVINSGLEGTTVTCVLIGTETYARQWVRYEILKSFKRGNSLLAVNINSIKGKDQRIKAKGPNPLSYLGVTFSDSGVTATLWEHTNGNWEKYSEIDGSSSYQIDAVAPQYRGKGFHLTKWCTEYDWATNDGYNNFGAWIG